MFKQQREEKPSQFIMEYDLIYVRFFLYYRLAFDPKPDWLILCWSVYFLQGVSAEGNDE